MPREIKPDTKVFLNYLLKSRAPSTAKKYLQEIQKFLKWTITHFGKVTIPVTDLTAALYLYNRCNPSLSCSSLVIAHAALKWLHTFVPYRINNPLDAPIVCNVLEAAKRNKANPITKKTPLTSTILKQIIEKHASSGADLKDLRIACICSVGFTGFLRYNELANITTNHVEFQQDYVRIFIPSSKTDICREGNYVYIKKIDTNYCPVKIMKRYLETSNASAEPNLPIFRPLRFFRSEDKFKLYGKKLSYTRCREIFKQTLKELGYDEKKFGLLSLRAGGATEAVNQGKISERLLKIHGRWKTDVAKDMYVHENIKNRLAVTGHLDYKQKR